MQQPTAVQTMGDAQPSLCSTSLVACFVACQKAVACSGTAVGKSRLLRELGPKMRACVRDSE